MANVPGHGNAHAAPKFKQFIGLAANAIDARE
jgi:hypothetical protein